MIVCDRGEGGSKSEKKCDVIFEWPLSAAEAIMLSLCPNASVNISGGVIWPREVFNSAVSLIAARYYASAALCRHVMSVRLSVCLSRSWILTKRISLIVSSIFFTVG